MAVPDKFQKVVNHVTGQVLSHVTYVEEVVKKMLLVVVENKASLSTKQKESLYEDSFCFYTNS